MLSDSLKEVKYSLDIITQISTEYGLEINSEKSCVMIFNVREQPEHLCNIKVVQKMKYLGIEIDNKSNYFKTQQGKINRKRQENGKYNRYNNVIEKSCNKLLIGKKHFGKV